MGYGQETFKDIVEKEAEEEQQQEEEKDIDLTRSWGVKNYHILGEKLNSF